MVVENLISGPWVCGRVSGPVLVTFPLMRRGSAAAGGSLVNIYVFALSDTLPGSLIACKETGRPAFQGTSGANKTELECCGLDSSAFPSSTAKQRRLSLVLKQAGVFKIC